MVFYISKFKNELVSPNNSLYYAILSACASLMLCKQHRNMSLACTKKINNISWKLTSFRKSQFYSIVTYNNSRQILIFWLGKGNHIIILIYAGSIGRLTAVRYLIVGIAWIYLLLLLFLSLLLDLLLTDGPPSAPGFCSSLGLFLAALGLVARWDILRRRLCHWLGFRCVVKVTIGRVWGEIRHSGWSITITL